MRLLYHNVLLFKAETPLENGPIDGCTSDTLDKERILSR